MYELQLPLWLEASLQIKQAGGLQRGKSDAIDAQRIAEYAYRFRDRLRLWQPPRAIIQQLAFLSATRQRLIQAYNQLSVPLGEQQSFVSHQLGKQLQQSCKASLAALAKDRKLIDQQINLLIQGDVQLKELFDLMTSIPGIGPATTIEVLVATNELQTITEPKKLACHAGVAPFDRVAGAI